MQDKDLLVLIANAAAGEGVNLQRGHLMVDAVEKVENRMTPKISQMVIVGLLRRCDAL
jgi:hypothetical protein